MSYDQNDGRGEEILDMPVEELGLSVRAYSCARRAGCMTVGDIVSRTENEMMGLRNIGRKAIEEIKGQLDALGLSFKEPHDEEVGENEGRADTH